MATHQPPPGTWNGIAPSPLARAPVLWL
jgi:hypothetical protein